MLKIIFSLLWNLAGVKEWQLQIGAYLLKKGCGYKIGQVIKEKKIEAVGKKPKFGKQKHSYRVKVVTGIFFDFRTNKINHTCENRIMKA